MQTGYENYWMGQTGRQETSPNLPKNNTAGQALVTGNFNSYKPNQSQHAIGTVRYSNCVNNYIPPQNEANSNLNRGAQSRGQTPQVYWTSSVVNGPHPLRHPFGNNFPQQVSAAQAKNFQYPIQALQAWQNNFSSKQLGNSDLSLTHLYNNNNYNNNNTYYNNNVGSTNGEMINGKAARIRVKDVFSINRVPGVQVPGNNFYGERVTEEYSCSLNFSPPESRKEDRVPKGYENVNLPSCRNLNHTQIEQYPILTSGQQQFPQQGNPPIVSKSQFPGYDGARVAEKNLAMAPFSSGGQTTVIEVASKSRTPNVLGENQRVKDERRKTVSEPIRSMNDNLYIPNPTSSPEKSVSQRFDLPVLLPSENDPPITCASTHYNNVPHTVIDLAIRNSSPKRNLSNNISNTEVLTTKSLQSFVMNPGEVQQPEIVNRVQDKVVTSQSNTTPNKKRPSDLIVDNHTKKILKAKDDLKDDDCTEIKKEPQNCNLIISEKPHKDGGNTSPKEISSTNIKNREKPSQSSPVDEPKTVYLSDGEIEESVFYHKKPGPKSKTMPEALEAAKNRMQYFDNHQEKANGDVKIRQEAKWDRNKLEMLKDYVISLTRISEIGKAAEGSKEVDSPQESESEGSCKRKNEEGLSRRRKLSKTSVIRNRNNEREMISLMSFKSAKVEITKCPGGSPLAKISDDGELMVNSPDDKEPVNRGNETKCPDKDAKDHDGENSTDVSDKNKRGSKEEAAPQNKSTKERILFSPKKKDTFEETAIINTMRAFQNLEYHYCMSCDLVSSNSSFWINVVSAELRCLNCFKKMVFKAKEASFKCKHSHCREEEETKTEEEVNDKKEGLVAKEKTVESGTTRVTSSKSRRESSNEKCSNQKSEFSKIDSNAETVIKTEDGTQNRLEIDGQKKRETETISKTKRSYSHDDFNVPRVGLEEKVKIEGNPVLGSSESTRRKSTSKDESSSHKTHVLDDRTKKEGKHSDRTKRESSKDEVVGNKSESKNKISTSEKTNRKRSLSSDDCSLEKDSSEKSKKRKKEPFTQRLISPKESNNEIKHSGSSDKEGKHKEDKRKKLVSEKNWQSITKKHDEEDDDGEPVKQRRKSTTEIIFREKENTKTRSLSPAGELEKSRKEHKKKEKVSHKMNKSTSEKQKALKVSIGRLIARDNPIKDKTKAFHRESGIIMERRHSEKISPDNNKTISKGKDHSGGEHSTKEKKIKGGDDFSFTPDHPPNIHPIKEKNLKHELKTEKHNEKRDVLLAQLLKKTKKLSKSLLEET